MQIQSENSDSTNRAIADTKLDLTLDETTATALVIVLHNHIEAMKAWQRKLKTPYLPSAPWYTPIYPKPTLNTTVHLMIEAQKLRLEILNISNTYLEGLTKEKQ